MKKKIAILVLIILIYSIFNSLITYALSQKEKGLILENFKSTQYDLIFNTDSEILNSEDGLIFDISKKINTYSNIKNKVTEKKEYIEGKKEELVNKIDSLEEVLNSLDEDINNLGENISDTNSQVINLKDEIKADNKQIELLRNKIQENGEILTEYLIYVFKKGNYVYDKEKIDNLKSIILSGEDISDVIDDLYFKGTIEVAGKKLVDQHKAYVRDLYINKVRNEKQELKLKELRKDLIIQRKILNDKKEAKEKLLKETKGKESLYQKYISDKIQLERNLAIKELKEKIKFDNIKSNILNKYNCEFIDLSKQESLKEIDEDLLISNFDKLNVTDRCLNISKILYSESLLKPSNDIGYNLLSWPIEPRYGISAYFRDTGYENEFGTQHDAIDIVTPQGTPIRAANDGYVVSMLKPINDGYAYIALKHSNGLVTVYGHVNEILVSEFDFVKKGDIIAKSGGEFGTNGAGVLTSGPHLHFEVYRDKEHIDPLNYLDISILPFSSLPEVYRYKYYSDFKDRKGYEYKNKELNSSVYDLDGDTEIERQKSLISKYAIGSFSNWDMWVEESLNGNIDPTFVMCLGVAESGLGKNLKTPFNVGNVGNTDSGGTYEFKNAREGVYWIVKTLNNKILGHYTEIRELSRYGNKNGSIYASSPDHWHNNIINCMSSIKGVYIPDYYEFRLSN